jgi:hypothetical protein
VKCQLDCHKQSSAFSFYAPQLSDTAFVGLKINGQLFVLYRKNDRNIFGVFVRTGISKRSSPVALKTRAVN